MSPRVGPDGELSPPAGDPPRLSCQQMIAIVTEASEGALDDEGRRDYDAHLLICVPCVTFIAQLDETRALVSGLDPQPKLQPVAIAHLEHAFREAFPT